MINRTVISNLKSSNVGSIKGVSTTPYVSNTKSRDTKVFSVLILVIVIILLNEKLGS